MPNISFAWTTPAVVIGQKGETRRDWSAKHLAMWLRALGHGRVVATAYDKSPRNGGKPFGTVEIFCITAQEDAREIRDEAWEREGFHVLTAIGAEFTKGWGAPDVWWFWRSGEPGANLQTVVGFRLIDLNYYGEAVKSRTLERLRDRKPVTLAELRGRLTGVQGCERV